MKLTGVWENGFLKLALHCSFQLLKVSSQMIPSSWHVTMFWIYWNHSYITVLQTLNKLLGDDYIQLAPIVEKYGGKR